MRIICKKPRYYMGLPYQVVFFYGRLLSEEDIMILLKQLEKYKPPLNDWRAEGRYAMEGFDEKAAIEAWYEDIRYDDYDWIEELETLFSGRVQIKTIATASREEPVELYLIINNIYDPIWDSDFQNHCIFDLEINTVKWDKYLRKACEAYKLPWEQPKFNLVINYNMENYLHSFAYQGILFYGLEVTDLGLFIKKILEKERHILEKLWIGNSYVMKKLYEKILGMALPDDESWDKNIIFDSPKFSEWSPKEEDVSELVAYGLMGFDLFDSLNELWEQRCDPVYLGSIATRDYITGYHNHVYLALRTTHHEVGYSYKGPNDDEIFFSSLELDKLEGESILRDKCAGYGLGYPPPKFHIILMDCYG